MANDPGLGKRVAQMLLDRGIETPMVNASKYNEANDSAFDHIKSSQCSIMNSLGLDLQDDSLRDTPKRVAKMYCQEIFTGLDYDNFPACTVVENKMKYDEMVAGSASVMSLCEHHFVPFMGVANIAYIPKNKVLGLSKFNRIVDFFSRRPQIQERLTEQLSATLKYILETDDVAVVIKAEHLCVKLRGVKDQQSVTITSKLSGRFKAVPELRSEFISLTR